MALDIEDGVKHSGKFAIDDREIDGELTFAGSDTKLYVHSPEFFRPGANDDRCIQGRLHDLTCVTLLDCLASSVPGSSWSTEGSFKFADIKPHFVVHGRRHIRPHEALIQEISFRLSDAYAIFQDYDAFATAIDPTHEQIRSLTSAMAKIAKRKISVGSRPQIAYFTGKATIFRVKTAIGTVFTSHSPLIDMGSSKGVSIKNHIWTGVRFEQPVTFDAAIDAIFPVLLFMQMIAGRRQEVSHVNLLLTGKDPVKRRLRVYWCLPPKRPDMAQRDRSLSRGDLPIDAIRDGRLFSNVLREWLERHSTWLPARARFADGFSYEHWYDTNRLIGAANMFDLLPSTAVPRAASLSVEMQQARKTSQEMFEAMPECPERDSVLNALGRLSKPNLKRKIHHRARPVIAAFGPRLPQLMSVLDLAVDARNHFVHGTTSKVDFSGRLSPNLHFLTNALEFVFALSDLHEAGYPLDCLKKGGSTQSHPFGAFLVSYGIELEQLKEVLPPSHKLVT